MSTYINNVQINVYIYINVYFIYIYVPTRILYKDPEISIFIIIHNTYFVHFNKYSKCFIFIISHSLSVKPINWIPFSPFYKRVLLIHGDAL